MWCACVAVRIECQIHLELQLQVAVSFWVWALESDLQKGQPWGSSLPFNFRDQILGKVHAVSTSSTKPHKLFNNSSGLEIQVSERRLSMQEMLGLKSQQHYHQHNLCMVCYLPPMWNFLLSLWASVGSPITKPLPP